MTDVQRLLAATFEAAEVLEFGDPDRYVGLARTIDESLAGQGYRLIDSQELERLRRVEAAARALDAEPWTTAAGKPSRRQLTANLRAALQDADARGGGARVTTRKEDRRVDTQETARAEAMRALAEAIHGSEHWRLITNRELAGRLLTYLDTWPAAKAALARYIEDGMTIIATDQVEAFCRSVLATRTSEATRGEGLREAAENAVTRWFDWLEGEVDQTMRQAMIELRTALRSTDHRHLFEPVGVAKVCECGLTLNKWSAALAAQPGEPPEEERA